MIRIVYIILLTFIIGGCSPARRLSIFKGNHPDLFKRDSVVRYEKLVVQGHRVDTVLQNIIHSHDTIVIHKNHITEKFYYRPDSSLYTSVTSDKDSTMKALYSYIDKMTVRDQPKFEHYLIIGGICLFVLILFMFFAVIALALIKKFI